MRHSNNGSRTQIALLLLLTGCIWLCSCQPTVTFTATRADFPPDRRSTAVALANDADGSVSHAMQASACLWLTPQDSPGLSWESIVSVYVAAADACQGINTTGCIGGNSATFRIAQCTDTNLDSPDGKFDGQTLVGPPTASLIGGGFTHCGLMDYPGWKFLGNCIQAQSFYQTCTDPAPPVCGPAQHPNHPYCGVSCQPSTTTDGAYAFRYPDGLGTDPQADGNRMFLSPYYYPVATSRAFRPVLQRIADGDGSMDGATSFVWKTSSADGGRLVENFSPSLFISRVRAFACKNLNVDESQLHYYKLVGVGINRHEVGSCNTEPDDPTTITAVGCPTLQTATPTHLGTDAASVAQVVEWRFDLQRDTADGNPGLNSGEPVCGEFLLNNAASTGIPEIVFANFPSIRPVGPPVVLQHAGRIDLDAGGRKTWLVDSIGLEGASPGISIATSSQPMPSSASPLVLQTGQKIFLDATIQRGPPGLEQATVTAAVHQQGDSQVTVLRQPISFLILSPAMVSIRPSPVEFHVDSTAPLKRNFLVVNDGASPFTLQSAQIDGALAADGRQQFVLDQINAGTGAPISLPYVINAGLSVTMEVSYCPTETNQSFSGTLAISGDDSSGGPPASAIANLTGDPVAAVPIGCVPLQFNQKHIVQPKGNLPVPTLNPPKMRMQLGK